ncbi:hypothetical protein Mgra_00005627, partial [Meloidogyne graminicola]
VIILHNKLASFFLNKFYLNSLHFELHIIKCYYYYYLFLFLLIKLNLGGEWINYPSPLDNAHWKCGVTKRTYVCDPDGLINEEERKEIPNSKFKCTCISYEYDNYYSNGKTSDKINNKEYFNAIKSYIENIQMLYNNRLSVYDEEELQIFEHIINKLLNINIKEFIIYINYLNTCIELIQQREEEKNKKIIKNKEKEEEENEKTTTTQLLNL